MIALGKSSFRARLTDTSIPFVLVLWDMGTSACSPNLLDLGPDVKRNLIHSLSWKCFLSILVSIASPAQVPPSLGQKSSGNVMFMLCPIRNSARSTSDVLFMLLF